MTRREEIYEASCECYNGYIDVVNVDADAAQDAFIKGAEWADKTMIEKARKWFNLHFRQVGTPREIKHDFESKEKMWKSFIQFMVE